MKLAKRTLAIVIAAILTIGMFATGASALTLEEFGELSVMDAILYLTNESDARSLISEAAISVTEDRMAFMFFGDIGWAFYESLVTVEQLVAACPNRNWELFENTALSVFGDFYADDSNPMPTENPTRDWAALSILWTPYDRNGGGNDTAKPWWVWLLIGLGGVGALLPIPFTTIISMIPLIIGIVFMFI